jgi:uncharacterized protein (TIGR02145 family)
MMKSARTVMLLVIILLTSCAKDVIEFNPAIAYGSFTDTRNNEEYKTVQIGDQTWMAENLRSLSNDPNEVSCCNYGKLFTIDNLEENCPEGWHLPDTSEWNTLVNLLGGNDIAGGKLKETGEEHWESPNTGATNSSGFTALGAGSANDLNGLKDRKKSAEFWTSTIYNGPPYYNSNYYISLRYDNEKAIMYYCSADHDDFEKKSVRCLKNSVK